MTTYTAKESEALESLTGDVEHLKILRNDIVLFLTDNGEDTTGYNADQIIELELRMSLYLSYFHICLEYRTRSKILDALEKAHPKTKDYLDTFSHELYTKFQKYRNKTFHENADLSADIKVKAQLDTRSDFENLDKEIQTFVGIWESEN